MNFARLYAWISGQWFKQPMILGYSGVAKYDYGLAAPSGATYERDGTAVPAGEIWVLQHASMWNEADTIASMAIYLNSISYYTPLVVANNPSANTAVIWNGSLVMEEGDYLSFYYNGEQEDERIGGGMWAMRVDIDQ